MNTKLTGLVSVILGTRGIETRPGTLARATMALLLLTSWGPAFAHEEQRPRHVRPLAFEANRGQADEEVKFLARGAGYTVFLSTDGVRNTGDILLTGARTVPILARSASSSASIAVTIPSTTLPGTYVLLACADDTKVVAESNDTNNCRASGTAVVVAP